ncbi:hypothetical protein J6590_050808 [Homalodisca vitripennis]|nr:hypothetical protein J6590_050808 [Homalodisca vitripennis]
MLVKNTKMPGKQCLRCYINECSLLPKLEWKKTKTGFNEHLHQWQCVFRKPLVIPSTEVEFEMPIWYKEEFFNKMSTTSTEPVPIWDLSELKKSSTTSQPSVQKSQHTLQYTREFCAQPNNRAKQHTTKISSENMNFYLFKPI